MKIRVISLLLVLVLLLTCIPAPASAETEDISVSAIQQQIKTVFRQALRRTGRSSFHGYCGTIVGWQIYLMGIDTKLHIYDGNKMYDFYSKDSVTSGGYRVKKYPASGYSLKESLNAITHNGQKDAYNIMVGFQRTNTTAGKIYGHAVMIHAIIDGRVYFMECFNMSIAGKYWPEGSAVSCTIDEFAKYYDRWTTFEGTVHFGLKNYAGACLQYPSDMQAASEVDVELYAEPCDPGVYDAEPTGEILTAGESVLVTSLLQTPQGAYWYELDYNNETRYARAENLTRVAWNYGDVQIANLKVPTVIRKGVGFTVKGNLSSQYCTIENVEMTVANAETGELMFAAAMDVGASTVSLSANALEKNMTFRKLPIGTYTLRIQTTVGGYELVEGVPVYSSETLEMKTVQFQVAKGASKYYVVTFDPTGGISSMDQITVYDGETIGSLPSAVKEGYVFAGWALDSEGKEPVTDQHVVTEATTLYALWDVDYENIHSALQEVEQPGWHMVNDSWHFHPKSGWFISNGYRFYQLSSGELLTGWQTIGDMVYYFNAAGVQLTHWQKIYGNTYYLYPAGNMAVGTVEIEGVSYTFDENGILQEN